MALPFGPNKSPQSYKCIVYLHFYRSSSQIHDRKIRLVIRYSQDVTFLRGRIKLFFQSHFLVMNIAVLIYS